MQDAAACRLVRFVAASRFPGRLIGAVSIFIYTRAVALLCATEVSFFTAAVPALTTLGGYASLAKRRAWRRWSASASQPSACWSLCARPLDARDEAIEPEFYLQPDSDTCGEVRCGRRYRPHTPRACGARHCQKSTAVHASLPQNGTGSDIVRVGDDILSPPSERARHRASRHDDTVLWRPLQIFYSVCSRIGYDRRRRREGRGAGGWRDRGSSTRMPC